MSLAEYEYRISPLNQLMAIVLIGFSIFIGYAAFTGAFVRNPKADIVFSILSSTLFFAIAAGLFVWTLKGLTEKILISDNRIEKRDIFRARGLESCEIAGWRVMQSGGGRSALVYYVEILPKEPTKPLKISESVKIDIHFKTWLLNFSNLTSSEKMVENYFAQWKL